MKFKFSAIAKDVPVDDKTVRKYFEVLEDTLIGFFLESFHTSVRRKVGMAPKFYFFDTGVTRALARNPTEIKYSTDIKSEHIEKLLDLRNLIDTPSECVWLSRDPVAQVIEGVRYLPWQLGLREYFTGPDLTKF